MKSTWILLLAAFSLPSLAANEEQFRWMGIRFCESTADDALQEFPDAIFHADLRFLEIEKPGATLGGTFERLFLYVNPDDTIHGMFIPMVAGDLREFEKALDSLAAERWSDRFDRYLDRDEIGWAGYSPGTDVSMALIADSKRFARLFAKPAFDPHSIGIVFRSIHACGWRPEN